MRPRSLLVAPAACGVNGFAPVFTSASRQCQTLAALCFPLGQGSWHSLAWRPQGPGRGGVRVLAQQQAASPIKSRPCTPAQMLIGRVAWGCFGESGPLNSRAWTPDPVSSHIPPARVRQRDLWEPSRGPPGQGRGLYFCWLRGRSRPCTCPLPAPGPMDCSTLCLCIPNSQSPMHTHTHTHPLTGGRIPSSITRR